MGLRTLITLTAAGAMALTGAVAGPASAAEGVDPDALAELVTATSTDAASWRSTGGSLTQRCVGSVEGTDIAMSARIAYEGAGGAAVLRYDMGGRLAGVGSGSTYYTGGKTAVETVSGVVKRALHKHGLAKVPAGYSTRSESNARTYREARDLGQVVGLDEMRDPSFWASLTMTTDGGTTTWTGTAIEEGNSADVTIVRRGGHVASYTVGSTEYTCTMTASFVRPVVSVPTVSTRANRLVADEAMLYDTMQIMNLFSAKKDGTTSVARVRQWGTVFEQDKATEVTKVRKGIMISTKSKGWDHRLVWKVTVSHGQAHFTPVAS